MDFTLPTRLLRQVNGAFAVIDPRHENVQQFDIISYTWSEEKVKRDPGISGVHWKVELTDDKIKEVKKLMTESKITYLWCDCVCINQEDSQDKALEMSRMFEYYKSAKKCHILMSMQKHEEVWDPLVIGNDLKFIDHVITSMGGAALASEVPHLSSDSKRRLSQWANMEGEEWTFPWEKELVRSAGIDMGVLNCYSRCTRNVRMLFRNRYFTRVWTFQEMILGKNITLWAINLDKISKIGELSTWMDLATNSKDKALKLSKWINDGWRHKTGMVNAILEIIEDDYLSLDSLQMQVQGINGARTDIINGGPHWWHENYRGIENIFSAISLVERKCRENEDIFKGLLGIFSGLFTPEEIARNMSGNDMETISFNFFKQLSIKTGRAWTKLAISSGERGEWDWIPVVENHNGAYTTDCFAGVVDIGRLKDRGQAKTNAITGLKGSPRKYMNIKLSQLDGDFQFVFKGCNCGKRKGTFSSETIPTNDQLINVARDQTGKTLVQCATILASILDPRCNIQKYRERLLSKLRPQWKVSDPQAKPIGWINRSVSGSPWENPNPNYLRTHNRSMNFRMAAITHCESRLWNESTKNISCEVRVNCGCTIVAPFALIFEAITAVEGSSLGETVASIDSDSRITLRDGMGLVQVGDVGKSFDLVAFGGDVNSYKSYAADCRSTKKDKEVVPKREWPYGRALVREEFAHGMTDVMRDYGFVQTGGSGNLLICRKNVIDQYGIIGVCIDSWIEPEKPERESRNVKIR